MIATVLVDTNVFTARLQEGSPLATLYAKHLFGQRIAVAPQTVAEARYGALSAGWGAARVERLSRLIARTRVLPVDIDTIEAVARLRNECRQMGHGLHQRAHNGLGLGNHQRVPVGVGEAHLLGRARCSVDDLPGPDPVREQLLAQRGQMPPLLGGSEPSIRVQDVEQLPDSIRVIADAVGCPISRGDPMQARIRAAAMSVTLVLACAPSSAVALTFSESPGSPYATTSPPFVPNSSGFLGGAATGDFNGDGISDVAVVDETGVPVFSVGESVSVLLGSRSGGLTLAPKSPVAIYSGGSISEAGPIASGDFNGDGNTDLAVVDAIHNTVAILLGNGGGEFHLSGTPTLSSGWGAASSIVVGDFNDDGKQDVAVVNESLNVLLGDGSGELTQAPASPLTLPAFGSSVAAGFFNADDRADLAVADISGHVSVYLSNAAGEVTATAQSPLALGEGAGYLASADFDRDGKADLAVVSPTSGNVAVLMGNGDGSLAPASGSPFPVPGAASSGEPGLPESIAIGSFVCPDVPDLAIANFNGSSDSVAVLEGDGSGEFTSPIGSPFSANGNPRPLVVGDFNGDGKPDIAVVNPFQGTLTELENTTGHEQCPPPRVPPSTPPTTPSGPTVLSHQSTGLAVGGPPSIEALALRRHTIHTGRNLSLKVKLSGSATIVVEFEKAEAGHGHAHRGNLLRLVGSVTHAGHSGSNSFTIKQVHGRKLAAGRYILVVFARLGAETSAARTITLTVRR